MWSGSLQITSKDPCAILPLSFCTRALEIPETQSQKSCLPKSGAECREFDSFSVRCLFHLQYKDNVCTLYRVHMPTLSLLHTIIIVIVAFVHDLLLRNFHSRDKGQIFKKIIAELIKAQPQMNSIGSKDHFSIPAKSLNSITATQLTCVGG